MSKLVAIASKYIGKNEDATKGNNNDFHDEQFEQLLEQVGWSEGLSWCAFFVRLVVREAYPNKWEKFNKILSGSVLKTMHNLRNNNFEMNSNVPSPGAIAIWQNGNTAFGHIGIVKSASKDNFVTIEGNTDLSGSRDGGTVAEKVRKYKFQKQPSGLWVRGFIDIEKDLKS